MFFWHRWHFYALSAIRIRPPSCYKVKAFPKCLLAEYALEHTMCTMCNVLKLSSRLSFAAHLWCTHVHRTAMFGQGTSDFTSVSLNIFHASQTICKRSAANVSILMLILFYTGFVKRSSVIFACQKRALQFFTLQLQFLPCWKKCVLQCKNRTALVIIGRILEQCIFTTGIVKTKQCKTERMFWALHRRHRHRTGDCWISCPPSQRKICEIVQTPP